MSCFKTKRLHIRVCRQVLQVLLSTLNFPKCLFRLIKKDYTVLTGWVSRVRVHNGFDILPHSPGTYRVIGEVSVFLYRGFAWLLLWNDSCWLVAVLSATMSSDLNTSLCALSIACISLLIHSLLLSSMWWCFWWQRHLPCTSDYMQTQTWHAHSHLHVDCQLQLPGTCPSKHIQSRAVL